MIPKFLKFGLTKEDQKESPVKLPSLKCGNPYCQEPILEGNVLYNPVTQKFFHTGLCEMYEELYFLSNGKKQDISRIHPYTTCPQNIMFPPDTILNFYFTPSKYISFEKAQKLYKQGKLNQKKLEEKVNS